MCQQINHTFPLLACQSAYFSHGCVYIERGGTGMEENTNPLRFETSPYHNVLIKDRKPMELSGVKQIDSFDSGEFLLETTLGWMLISGKELTLGKLDTEHGDVVIKGNIDSVSYISGKKGQDHNSMFSRLFK